MEIWKRERGRTREAEVCVNVISAIVAWQQKSGFAIEFREKLFSILITTALSTQIKDYPENFLFGKRGSGEACRDLLAIQINPLKHFATTADDCVAKSQLSPRAVPRVDS